MTRRLILAVVLLVLMAGCGDLADKLDTVPSVPTTTTTIPIVVGRPWPDLTPGVAIAATREQVCTPGWAARHRQGLTPPEKRWLLHAYGYPPDQKVAEWDHLLSLELGGGNGPKNIFPMVDPAQAHRKDLLENRLHDAVCAGKMALEEAQRRIRNYWRFW
jgi:hypothetical protein